jgi:hypothetical protein
MAKWGQRAAAPSPLPASNAAEANLGQAPGELAGPDGSFRMRPMGLAVAAGRNAGQ